MTTFKQGVLVMNRRELTAWILPPRWSAESVMVA